MKALLLALLANLFLLTRNDQATKMLHSAYVISRGMGGNANTSQPPLESSGGSADVVGNPRLGLWIGEQLLGTTWSLTQAASYARLTFNPM